MIPFFKFIVQIYRIFIANMLHYFLNNLQNLMNSYVVKRTPLLFFKIFKIREAKTCNFFKLP